MRLIYMMIAAVIVCGSLTGCETVKGGAQGFAKDVEKIPNYVEGVWAKLQEADVWVKEHLW